MDESTKFILERLEKLRDEVKEDLHSALKPVNRKLSEHDSKHERIEKIENRIIGAALIVSVAVQMISKHL
jgi:hypothetical protein